MVITKSYIIVFLVENDMEHKIHLYLEEDLLAITEPLLLGSFLSSNCFV